MKKRPETEPPASQPRRSGPLVALRQLAVLLHPEFRPALALGLLGSLGAIALYGSFHIVTGLEPGLLGVPAGLLIGHAVRYGASGRRAAALGKLTIGLVVVAFAFSHAPSALLRSLGDPDPAGPLWAVAGSVVERLFALFLNQQVASFSAFVQLGLSLIMLVAGGFIARTMNE